MKTRQLWIEKGYEHFGLCGPEMLSIKKIAKELSIARTSFNCHFKSKDEFIDDLLSFHYELHSRFIEAGKLYCKKCLHDPKYHLAEDMTEKAIEWLRTSNTINPAKFFFMYYTPGAVNGPHHIFKEWADKYEGKFDEGWEALREMTFEKQKEMGWIPEENWLPMNRKVEDIGLILRI